MDALNSVLYQNFKNFEVIVVDDGSIDDTEAKVSSIDDTRVKLIKNHSIERSAARNTGITVAQSKYICFLDDDDRYEVNFLDDFYMRLEQLNFPTDTIIRTGFYKLMKGDSKFTSDLYNEKRHNNPVKFAAYTMCGVWTLCIPSQCLAENRFDERFPHWQDTHLILRLLSKYKLAQLDSYNYCYRIHDNMGSNQLYNASELNFKADINVEAIKDFFTNHVDVVHKYLSKDTLSFLVAEKYVQYAVRASKTDKRLSFKLFKKSLAEGIFLRNFKYYFALLKSLL